MKIVFFGTSEFAVPSLRKLASSRHQIELVVTQPDRKKGRHLCLAPTPVKIEAEKLKLPLYQPEDISSTNSTILLKKKDADLFIVIAFGRILKKETLKLPKLYSINLHASLLPKYRGAAPINWAIINGEKETGISVIRMAEKMDAGDIVAIKKAQISDDDTGYTLSKKLSNLGADTILEVIDMIEKGNVKFGRQDDNIATYAPKLKKETGCIDWTKPAIQIHNLVRGLIPWPAAYTFLDAKTLKIWQTEIDNRTYKSDPGTIIALEDKGIIVKTGKDNIVIKELQLEGSKKMSSNAFLLGHHINIGYKFFKI